MPARGLLRWSLPRRCGWCEGAARVRRRGACAGWSRGGSGVGSRSCPLLQERVRRWRKPAGRVVPRRSEAARTVVRHRAWASRRQTGCCRSRFIGDPTTWARPIPKQRPENRSAGHRSTPSAFVGADSSATRPRRHRRCPSMAGNRRGGSSIVGRNPQGRWRVHRGSRGGNRVGSRSCPLRQERGSVDGGNPPDRWCAGVSRTGGDDARRRAQRTGASSSTARTRWARSSTVKGLPIRCTPGSSTPLWTTALRV